MLKTYNRLPKNQGYQIFIRAERGEELSFLELREHAERDFPIHSKGKVTPVLEAFFPEVTFKVPIYSMIPVGYKKEGSTLAERAELVSSVVSAHSYLSKRELESLCKEEGLQKICEGLYASKELRIYLRQDHVLIRCGEKEVTLLYSNYDFSNDPQSVLPYVYSVMEEYTKSKIRGIEGEDFWKELADLEYEQIWG